ncbi:acyl-CoA N-acyltransferase [Colletotrichum godetiae]|uniref:Acyl-CoA N-acyltransferase n=1 Tax=Colletotrichum godetiae TaxID=1209918 RepID=A0AAJ0A833_9PEZI|nr:acyl-CoA N-acyltransferase [Colletotrichum godetiae]KAK1658269.1 acyl-CoA N-acyltransferase [Colletotrichum godetiae]
MQEPESNDPPTAVILRQATNPADIAASRKCFEAYTKWLDEDISFQNYAEELSGLPGKYSPPSGALLLAIDSMNGNILGCIAMRPIRLDSRYLLNRQSDARYCEIKRLFVYPEARGKRVSRLLVREVLRRAEEQGYDEAVLDTMTKMQAAIKLYASEGFEETSPYYYSPLNGALYMSKRLSKL